MLAHGPHNHVNTSTNFILYIANHRPPTHKAPPIQLFDIITLQYIELTCCHVNSLILLCIVNQKNALPPKQTQRNRMVGSPLITTTTYQLGGIHLSYQFILFDQLKVHISKSITYNNSTPQPSANS